MSDGTGISNVATWEQEMTGNERAIAHARHDAEYQAKHAASCVRCQQETARGKRLASPPRGTHNLGAAFGDIKKDFRESRRRKSDKRNKRLGLRIAS